MDTDQNKKAQSEIADLPDLKKADSDKVAAEVAENVKGGRARRGGDDDDLDDWKSPPETTIPHSWRPHQMSDKQNAPTNQPKADEIKDLPPKKLSREDEDKTKGGRREAPATQTEDDLYIG